MTSQLKERIQTAVEARATPIDLSELVDRHPAYEAAKSRRRLLVPAIAIGLCLTMAVAATVLLRLDSEESGRRAATQPQPPAAELVPSQEYDLGRGAVALEAVIAGDVLLVSYRESGDITPESGFGVVSFDVSSGEELARVALPGEVTRSGMAVDNGQLWISTIDEFSIDGTALLRLDLATNELTTIDLLHRAAALAVSPGAPGALLVLQEGLLEVRDRTSGAVLESQPGFDNGFVDAGGAGVWLTQPSLGTLHRVETGQALHIDTTQGLLGPLVVRSDDLLVAQGALLQRFSPSQNAPLDAVDIGAQIGAFDVAGSAAWVTSTGGRLTHVDLTSGRQTLGHFASPTAIPEVVAVSADSAIICPMSSVCTRVELT